MNAATPIQSITRTTPTIPTTCTPPGSLINLTTRDTPTTLLPPCYRTAS